MSVLSSPPIAPPRRIRVPFLLDLVLADQMGQIDELNADVHLARGVRHGGPLLNRLLSRRLARAFTIGSTPLPTFTEREDVARAARQEELEARLGRAANEIPAQAGELGVLSEYVNGHATADGVGVAVQGLVGRLFDAGYRATSETYEASRTVVEFPRALPHRTWWWRLTGKLARSQRLLATAANGDPVAIHATTNTVHNIVATLARMQTLVTKGGGALPAASAVARCLSAPPALPRWCTAETRVAGLAKPLRPGTIVLLRLDRAHDRINDMASPFLTGAWNRCPAHAYVTALLERVWSDARR